MLSAYTSKGTTIITLEAHYNNKLGCSGVYNYHNKYRVDISCNNKKYLAGIFNDFDYACRVRKICEIYRDCGKLENLISNKPHGNSVAFINYWNNILENYNI